MNVHHGPLELATSRRARNRRLGAVLSVFALVSIPVLWSAGAHMTGGWLPDGDDASIARRTQQVFTTDPPLIGHESTADVPVQDQTPNHPGPIGYYVMAIPYAVSGWSPEITLMVTPWSAK